MTVAHSASVRSLGYRNLLRSYRTRVSLVHTDDPHTIRKHPVNHKRFISINCPRSDTEKAVRLRDDHGSRGNSIQYLGRRGESTGTIPITRA
jgi:hypothetical protein